MDAISQASIDQGPAHDRQATTDLLNAWSGGNREAEKEIIERIYPELRRLAAVQLRQVGNQLTLAPTELAHEAYLKLIDQRQSSWQNRAHFFAITARLVRRLVLNYVRDRSRDKRGGGWAQVTMEKVEPDKSSGQVDLLALDTALDELGKIDSDAVRIVELRYFVGLTVEEIAEMTQRSPSSVAREWRSARVWLKSRLS